LADLLDYRILNGNGLCSCMCAGASTAADVPRQCQAHHDLQGRGVAIAEDWWLMLLCFTLKVNNRRLPSLVDTHLEQEAVTTFDQVTGRHVKP
jgi:hypothetical protein